MHNGTLDIKSKLGEGTEVIVTLPNIDCKIEGGDYEEIFKNIYNIMVAIYLSACNYNEFTAANKISSPKIEPSILGKWKVETYKYLNTDAPEDTSIKYGLIKLLNLTKT